VASTHVQVSGGNPVVTVLAILQAEHAMQVTDLSDHR
jgi:hypothetical protein